MSFEEKLCAAVRSVLPESAPGTYEGNALIYGTWNHNELGKLFADGRPHSLLHLVQVHVYLPKRHPWAEIKTKMRKALFALGGTWPDITNAGDESGEHFVFEFEVAEGIE